ncbi:C6 zinc finger domain-containing protein [Colletotrichum navitas]|uniref:C6 zinc finger domain-containing protein n=1 Tax=Colletotrichum navitas TaxID=681940 RepID=A0AAD8Q603_9PEZI|nr:C6 zinc finger domain-containing protein [Colletotrichum navitas]KAK1596551.1 C6 zinc finger domain-containing protein [Colletotrichum navitas]
MSTTVAVATTQVAGTLAIPDVSSKTPPAEPSPAFSLVRYQTISQPMDDLARTYFTKEYIASSPFEYLPRLCPYGLQNNDAMSASILAASFASLSLKVSEPKMMKMARIHYARALSQTNQALSSPERAVEDSTLAAVLLLGLFEAIVYSGQQSLDTWNQHALGAVELLRLRGTRQFDTPLGRQLFVHSSGNIRTSCAHTKTPVPERFLKVYENAKPHLDLDDPFLKMTPILDRIATLRSRIASLTDSERHEVLYEALDLDAATAKLGQKVPEEWRFTARHPGERSPISYKGMSFRYPSLLVLRYWNSLRTIRMFLNDVIWIQSSLALDRGPEPDDETDYEGLQRSASRKISSLVVEVLGSCGEYLEFSEDRFSISAKCLIWPLSVIAEISSTPPDARRFALDCLDRLGRGGRIPMSVAETDCPRVIRQRKRSQEQHMITALSVLPG